MYIRLQTLHHRHDVWWGFLFSLDIDKKWLFWYSEITNSSTKTVDRTLSAHARRAPDNVTHVYVVKRQKETHY